MAEATFSSPSKNLSFEQLAAVRKRTQVVADFLEKQLLGYLDTLRSLILPERILGKLAGSKFDVPGADKTLAELQENYRRLPGKPFDFPKEFETDWLSEVGVKVELQRWEYSREIASESGNRSIHFAGSLGSWLWAGTFCCSGNSGICPKARPARQRPVATIRCEYPCLELVGHPKRRADHTAG
jgi:hypothetical protein